MDGFLEIHPKEKNHAARDWQNYRPRPCIIYIVYGWIYDPHQRDLIIQWQINLSCTVYQKHLACIR
jgi:hypothetical protein